MAKFNNNKKDLINEDLIKEALKSGLKDIKPSEKLIANTIERCNTELLSENKVNYKRSKPYQWAYRLGAPIAACALVLLLILNYDNIFFRYKATKETEPQSSAYGIARSSDTRADDKFTAFEDKAGSSAPEVASPESTLNEKLEIKYFSFTEETDDFHVLRSYPVRTSDMNDTYEHQEAFRYIASTFNSDNKVDYVLDEVNILQVNTLIEEGVDADALQNTESYRNILSDEGYWALPLNDNKGTLKAFLRVADINDANTVVSASGNEKIYNFNDKMYFVSTYESPEISNLETMFDKAALMELIEQNYNIKNRPVIVDINNGRDFVVFFEDSEKQMGIPFFTNRDMFGLENSKIYETSQMFTVISECIR